MAVAVAVAVAVAIVACAYSSSILAKDVQIEGRDADGIENHHEYRPDPAECVARRVTRNGYICTKKPCLLARLLEDAIRININARKGIEDEN